MFSMPLNSAFSHEWYGTIASTCGTVRFRVLQHSLVRSSTFLMSSSIIKSSETTLSGCTCTEMLWNTFCKSSNVHSFPSNPNMDKICVSMLVTANRQRIYSQVFVMVTEGILAMPQWKQSNFDVCGGCAQHILFVWRVSQQFMKAPVSF